MQLKSFMSYNKLRDKVLELNTITKYGMTPITPIVHTNKNYKEKENVRIAITNNDKFANILIAAKKFKSSIVFITVDNEYNQVILFSKSSIGMPLFMLSIPINGTDVYANDFNSRYYEIDVSKLIVQQKYTNRRYYTFVLSEQNQEITIEYQLHNNLSEEPDRFSYSQFSQLDSRMFTTAMSVTIDGAKYEIGISELYSSTIILISSLTSNNTIMGINKNATNRIIEITDSNIICKTHSLSQTISLVICSKNDKQLWPDNEITLKLVNISKSLKISQQKIKTSSDILYTVLCKYNNIYVLMRILSSAPIEDSYSVTSILHNHTTFSELYLCIPIETN